MSREDQFLGRCVLAACLAVTGAAKLIGSSGPPSLSVWWVWLACVVEFVAAGLLLSRLWRVGAMLGGVFGVAALLAVAIMRIQGISPSRCGCFGSWDVSDRVHVLVALGFVVISSGLMWQAGPCAPSEPRLPYRANSDSPSQ